MTTFAAAADDVRFSVKLLLFGKCKIVSVIVAWGLAFSFLVVGRHERAIS